MRVQDAETHIQALRGAALLQGHSARFVDQAISKGRLQYFAVLNEVTNGQRPLYRPREFRRQQRGVHRRVSKPGLACIWASASHCGAIERFVNERLRIRNLREVLQFDQRSGPSLIELMVPTAYRLGPPPCQRNGCLVCIGRDLPFHPVPEIAHYKELPCNLYDFVYLAWCSLCTPPVFYVGQTGNPAWHRVDGHFYRGALREHMDHCHNEAPCFRFLLISTSRQYTSRRLCETNEGRWLKSLLHPERARCLNSGIDYVPLW